MRLFLALLALASLVGCTSEEPAKKAATPELNTPAYFETVQAALPLPKTMPPSVFAEPGLAKVYEIAQRIPAVLAQQPCYCYCDKGHGHRSLLDCQRDQHSAGCAVCRKEVLLADKMVQSGRSAADIREAIIRGDWKTVVE